MLGRRPQALAAFPDLPFPSSEAGDGNGCSGAEPGLGRKKEGVSPPPPSQPVLPAPARTPGSWLLQFQVRMSSWREAGGGAGGVQPQLPGRRTERSAARRRGGHPAVLPRVPDTLLAGPPAHAPPVPAPRSAISGSSAPRAPRRRPLPLTALPAGTHGRQARPPSRPTYTRSLPLAPPAPRHPGAITQRVAGRVGRRGRGRRREMRSGGPAVSVVPGGQAVPSLSLVVCFPARGGFEEAVRGLGEELEKQKRKQGEHAPRPGLPSRARRGRGG